jgi:hypothetical protein
VSAESGGMLTMLGVALFLFALGAYGIARVAQEVMTRRGLDLMSVLLWLGLAERPIEPGPPRARTLDPLTG